MNFGLTARVVAVSMTGFAVIASVAALGLSSAIVVGTALLVGGLVATAIVWLLKPCEQLKSHASETLRQMPRLIGEAANTSTVTGEGHEAATHALRVVLDRLKQRHTMLQERERQFSTALTQLQTVITAILSDGKSPVPPLAIESPWPQQHQPVIESLGAVARFASQTSRRSQTLYAIINELPEALLVCDDKLDLVLTNTAANKLLRTVDVQTPKRLTDLFIESPTVTAQDPDVPAAIGVNQLREMVQQSRGSQFVAHAKDGAHTPIAIRMLPAGQRIQKGMRVLLARDASHEISTQVETRHRHRRDVGLRMCLLVNKEAGSTLESIRTQATLLSQAAKQAGQREKFLPKIGRLLDDLSKQEAIVNLLGWLGRLNQSNATQPEMSEIKLKDLVVNAFNQMKSMFAERSNTFEISGDAGWIVADEEWIGVMLSGLLLHINHSVQQTTVQCGMRRRTGSDTRLRAECCEVSMAFKGQPLSAELLADVYDPFGRVNSTALAPAGVQGFPLGLAVAARVARLMDGDILAEADKGEVILRVLVPIREQDSHIMMRAVPVRESVVEVDTSESLGSWSIGGKTAIEDDEPTPVTTTAVSDEPFVSDETVGGWFGGSPQ